MFGEEYIAFTQLFALTALIVVMRHGFIVVIGLLVIGNLGIVWINALLVV